MRYVVLHGRLWDDLYIGFQNRISRDPDIYHHKYSCFITYIKVSYLHKNNGPLGWQLIVTTQY